MTMSNLISDTIYIRRLVDDLQYNDLQSILESVNGNKYGSESVIRNRILILLSTPSVSTIGLRERILEIHRSRTNYYHQQQIRVQQSRQQQLRQQLRQQQLRQQQLHQQQLRQQQLHQQQLRQQQLRQQQLCRQFTHFRTPRDSRNMGRQSQISPQPITNSIPRSNVTAESSRISAAFKDDLTFYKINQTVMVPMIFKNSNQATFTVYFYLSDNIRQIIEKSWNFVKLEHGIQVILRLAPHEPKENKTEHLPNNICVSVNNCACSLPELIKPNTLGGYLCRPNVPINVTRQTNLKEHWKNCLKLSWNSETHSYIAGIYVAKKLTYKDLLDELKTKPLRASHLTRELIKKSMERDNDMGIDYMFTTIKDPLSKTRMQLPARGVDCIHMQCFDAVTFLQMNELKETWLCPICKKKVRFENIEVDEYFFEMLQSPLLTDDCEDVLLFKNGDWALNKNKEDLKKSSQDNSKQPDEVHVLSDSDDDYEPEANNLKPVSPDVEKSVVKHEHILEAKNQTKRNVKKSSKNDFALDLSLRNNASTSSSVFNNESATTSNHDLNLNSPPSMEPSNMLSNSKYCKPSSGPETRTRNRQVEKNNSRKVLFVVTLD